MLFFAHQAEATHIRAGEICAVRISQSSLTYRFTLTIYTDRDSNVEVTRGGLATFRFGDGTEYVGGDEIAANAVTFTETAINQQVGRVVIEFEYTFQAPGIYVVSYTEENRNPGIVNINDSVNTPFHVQTIVRIDADLSPNSSPKLTIPPIDRACIGKRFFHNPGAFDPNGDSLAYKLVTPQLGPGTDIGPFTVLNDPSITGEREDGGSPGLYEIDPITGTFVWDAPARAGEYNIAFIVEEWRFSESTGQMEILGFVTRDMQIIVEDCDNERPVLEVPEELCVEAGTTIDEILRASDPDGDEVSVEGFGGPFNNSGTNATLTPGTDFQATPLDYQFLWETDLSHVQERPYQVQFKIEDNPIGIDRGPSLVDFVTWDIRVVAPAPTGLSGGLISARSVQLVWDSYIGRDFAEEMEVWRRVESFDFDPTDCNVGIPANSGYERVQVTDIALTNLVDNNGLVPGATYCYRLVAKFPLPRGGESYASQEFCVTIPTDQAVITNVSVLETDAANGEIQLRWTSPLEIDDVLFPPPYQYEVVRYTGLSGSTGGDLVVRTTDTSYIDTNLNTLETPYHYEVNLFSQSAPDDLIGTSAPASSVRLEALSVVNQVEVEWRADVPWSNQISESPYHYIYRNRTDPAATAEDVFVLIDSIDVRRSSFVYQDDGQFNGAGLIADLEYCYYVTTQGSYGNPIIAAPLINDSQIVCSLPGDDIPPLPPEITIDPLAAVSCENLESQPCGFSSFSNTIEWVKNVDDNDVGSYNIYFSATGLEEDFELIASSRTTRFIHTGLPSYKGCYKISAVDRSNNESALSEQICFDNCPYYELPNTFTPNADGVNDTFHAFDQPNGKCPRFVEQVEFQLFNRWGGDELYSYSTCDQIEPDFFINWDGKDKNGKDLPSGTYYYRVIVTFDVLDPQKRTQEFKNWVQLIR